METFYNILYCPIRPVVDERLSIALLVRAQNKVFFKYSHDKLKVIKELLPESAFNLLKSSLKNIDAYFNERNRNENSTQILLDGLEKHPENFLNPEYFEYLNKYSNNLLHFSRPKSLDLIVTDELFETLYNKLIFGADSVQIKKNQLIERVRQKIDPKIKNHVNLQVELTSKQIASLVVPTPVWFIGKNDKDVTGEIIDFDKATSYLENDIRNHLYLLQSLKNGNQKYHAKHFLVGNEPKKTNLINHSIWDELRNLPLITYLPSKETEEITEYIKSHHVSPYFENQNELVVPN
jgi:hypothetical protein